MFRCKNWMHEILMAYFLLFVTELSPKVLVSKLVYHLHRPPPDPSTTALPHTATIYRARHCLTAVPLPTLLHPTPLPSTIAACHHREHCHWMPFAHRLNATTVLRTPPPPLAHAVTTPTSSTPKIGWRVRPPRCCTPLPKIFILN